MGTVHKPHWGLHWHHRTPLEKRDPIAEQLHRDQMTALFVLGTVAVIFAGMIALAVIFGGPSASPTFAPWLMP